MFYIMRAEGDKDGNIIDFNFDDDDVEDKDFELGKKLSTDVNANEWEKAPIETIRLNIQKGCKNAPLPGFMSQPAPIMSKELLATVRAAGVNNIDAYKAELYYADGSLASEDYFVINVVGVISAADLEKSSFDANQEDDHISMSFDSLTIDKEKSHGLLMFRLAENIVQIIMHEQVKQAIEKAKIPYIRISETKNVAIL